MSEFGNFMYVDVQAEIACGECGQVEDAHGGSEREAETNLAFTLKREGWEVKDGKPLCRGCANPQPKTKRTYRNRERKPAREE